jgi:hypothetical protein
MKAPEWNIAPEIAAMRDWGRRLLVAVPQMAELP